MHFETVLHSEDMKELSNATFSTKVQYLIHGLALYSIVVGFISISTDLLLTFGNLISVVLFEGFLYVIKRKSAKVSQNRFIENYGEKAHLVFDFTENTILTGSSHLNYDSLSQYIETTKFVVLLTKSKQFIALNKEEANQKELLSFLINKNKSLKVKKRG